MEFGTHCFDGYIFLFQKGGLFSKRLHIWIEEEWGTRPFIYFCSFCLFIQLHCFFCFVRKKLFCSSKKIVLCIADCVLYCLSYCITLVCKFANIKYKSYSYKCMKFFFKKCWVCVLMYKYMIYMWGQYDRE